MNKDLKRLSRKDLLQILINQNNKIDELTLELDETKKKLEDKEIIINESGSLAEASLKLSKIFESADASAKLYLDNISKLKENLEKKIKEVDELKSKLKESKKKTSTKKTTKKEVKVSEKKKNTKTTVKKNTKNK